MGRAAVDRATPTTLRPDDTIYLAGWMADPPSPLLELPGDQKPSLLRTNALARTRVLITPSPVGSLVHIPGAFTQVVLGDSMAMPFDPGRGEWLDAFTAQDFVIGFGFPQGIGKVRTKSVTLHLQANLPQQTITLMRGQLSGGKFVNVRGPEIVKWNQLIGTQSITFDVSDGDVDANGWLWLHVNVDSPPGQSRWRIENFSAEYDGVVEGPPQPVVLPMREQEPAAPPKPVNAAPKPAAAKKPTSKPATKPTTKAAPKKKAGQPQ